MIDQDLKNLNEPLKKNGNNHPYLVDESIWLDELGDSHQTTSIETPVNTEFLNKTDVPLPGWQRCSLRKYSAG
jgi:hypothetical protein